MNIICGKLKGRKIHAPKGIRPTQNKVRKAIFDILSDVGKLSFLELFAGSGAVGLEAASQGAGQVVFIEKDPACISALKKNLAYLPPGGYCLLPLDAFKAIGQLAGERAKFDVIFLDPPYYKDKDCRLSSGPIAGRSGPLFRRIPPPAITCPGDSLARKTLKMLSTYDILALNGFIIIQHYRKDNLPLSSGDLVLFRQSRYADTILSFYKKNSS